MTQEKAGYQIPVSFHFKVSFLSEITELGDTMFQSVSGLNVTVETEEYAEGGENRFVYALPKRTKYPNLVLKRGVFRDSELIKWCKNALENFEFKPLDMQVSLLNEKHEPLYTWNIIQAFPVKWSVTDFNAEESKLLVETFELRYQYFTVKKP